MTATGIEIVLHRSECFAGFQSKDAAILRDIHVFPCASTGVMSVMLAEPTARSLKLPAPAPLQARVPPPPLLNRVTSGGILLFPLFGCEDPGVRN